MWIYRCKHPGISCPTGLGHTRVYPILKNDPPLRTKQSMLLHGNKAVNDDIEYGKGIKGPSIVATIPHFNWTASFDLWFDNMNCNKPFYIKKAVKTEIDDFIKRISPPDFIIRTPRQL